MSRVSFRDPVPGGDEAPGLRLQIASSLLGVQAIPAEIQPYRLTLLDVEGSRTGIGLILGKSDPIARVRVRAKGPHSLVQPGTAGAPVDVDVEPLISDLGRFRADFEGLAAKLRSSVTAEQWATLTEPARRLGALPSSVPMAYFRQLVPGMATLQGLVRTGFNCNQDCGICWQGRDWGRYDSTQILTWIEDLAKAGARALIISGGEPTLDSHLEEYIRTARRLGFHAVTLETNAIQFAKKEELAPRLREAGLSDCFVSLHSGDAATSDTITRAPGTHARTVAGVQALLAAGIPVQLNCVLTREGLDHVGGLPDFIHQSFGAHPKLRGLMLSQPAVPFDQSLLPTILPDPARLRAELPQVIDRAFALGIRVIGLDGTCGPPLCAFGADPRITSLRAIAERLTERVWLPACEGCAVKQACFGVRIGDVQAFGDACVQPIGVLPARN